MLEFINSNNFMKDDYFYLVQATNPFLKSSDIDLAYKRMKNKNNDSLISCVNIKRFFWNKK